MLFHSNTVAHKVGLNILSCIGLSLCVETTGAGANPTIWDQNKIQKCDSEVIMEQTTITTAADEWCKALGGRPHMVHIKNKLYYKYKCVIYNDQEERDREAFRPPIYSPAH